MEKIKLFYYNHKSLIILIILILLFTCYICYKPKKELENKNILLFDESLHKPTTSLKKVETEVEYISVDIKGHVKKPGVYQFIKGANQRIADAIRISGGLLSDADTSITNLAKKITDEMVIIIFSKSEVRDFSKKENEINQKIESCQSTVSNGCLDKENTILPQKDSSKKETLNNLLININNASISELMTLQGIGESKAQAIIDYRKEKKFTKIEDIIEVKGIGESVFKNIKNNITV